MANPEDTRQIFVIFRALRGKSGLQRLRRFQASAVGRAVLAERRVLLDRLTDRAAPGRPARWQRGPRLSRTSWKARTCRPTAW